jgi:hypothetical protein
MLSARSFRARPEIRTPTLPGLSRQPLPIGLDARFAQTREMESNRRRAGSEPASLARGSGRSGRGRSRTSRRPLIMRLRCRCATRPCVAVRTRIELALGGRQPPRFPDAYRTRCVAPGAGLEPAVRRSTGVCVANFATLVEADVPSGPHRGATPGDARRFEYRPGIEPGSLAWKARSWPLGQRYDWSDQWELPPRFRLGKPACL